MDGGTWTGTGVTFYFADQSMIQFNSGAAINIKAPTSGQYKDLVMFEKSGLAVSQLPFNNAPNFTLDGIIYLPSRVVYFNRGSRLTGDVTVVVDQLILDQTQWNISPADDAILASGGIKSVHLIQ